MPRAIHPIVATFAAALLLAPTSLAFNTPLSEEAVREAYFLGQRHDEAFALLLNKYTQHLAQPKSGPYVESIAFFTPYALAVLFSSQQAGSYSAQEAQIDHRQQPEFVRIVVQIVLTDSYGPYLVSPTSPHSGSPKGIAFRSSGFWKDFRFHVFDNDEFVIPSHAEGQPTFRCVYKGGCILTGATVTYEYPADAFSGNTVTIQVDPPESDPVSVDFDVTTLR